MADDKQGGADHPMAEKGPPSFLMNAPRMPTPKAMARDATVSPDRSAAQPPRDVRDIRELAQRIDNLMFEIIERLENLNGWLGQLPRVK